MSAGNAGALLHAMDIEVRIQAIDGKSPLWVTKEEEAGNWIFDSVQNFIRDVFSGRVQVDRDRVEPGSFTRFLAVFVAPYTQYATTLQGDLSPLCQRLQNDLAAKFGSDHQAPTVKITPIRAYISESTSAQPGGYGGGMMSSPYFNQGQQPPYGGNNQMPAPYAPPAPYQQPPPWQQQPPPGGGVPPGGKTDDEETVLKGRSVAVLGAVLGGTILAAIAFGSIAWVNTQKLSTVSAELEQSLNKNAIDARDLEKFRKDQVFAESLQREVDVLITEIERAVATKTINGRRMTMADLKLPEPPAQEQYILDMGEHIKALKAELTRVRNIAAPRQRL